MIENLKQQHTTHYEGNLLLNIIHQLKKFTQGKKQKFNKLLYNSCHASYERLTP